MGAPGAGSDEMGPLPALPASGRGDMSPPPPPPAAVPPTPDPEREGESG